MLPIPWLGRAWTGGTVLTLLVALAPALFAWWSDRRLLARHDDPALPELIADRRRADVRVVAVALAFLIVFGSRNAGWAIPLLLVLLIAAAYPRRTRLLGETWSFGGYLWHSLVSIVGGFGFWVALAYAPIIVQQFIAALGTSRLPVIITLAVALAAVLFAWEAWYPRIWLWAHAAAPLDDAALTPRFSEIVRRAGTIVPDVFRVGPQGSRFVNAVALPSMKRSSVAMGSALLELLDADEATAIFAHEVAHFDQFTPRRLRRSQLVNRLLIVTGVALPIVAVVTNGGWSAWITWVWPIVVLVALVQRAAKSQQHETESDLRAAALCGDPEALVRGLVKLHLHARIPRRYAVDVERAASHPSLVRRIQAIRAGGAAAVEQLGAATVIRSTRDGSWIVLDDARAYWLDGVPEGMGPELSTLRDAASSYRAVNYADLVELRVSATADARSLTARTRGGDVWSVPIAAADVARVQRTLDVVDVRLGKVGPAPGAGMARVVPLVAAVVAIVAGQAGIVLVPIALAIWKPSAGVLAALGAMSVVRAMLGAWQGSTWFDENVVQFGLIGLAVVGIGAMYLAYRLVKAGEQRSHFRLTMGVLAAASALVVVELAWQASQMPASPVGAPLLGTLATGLFGMAAALFTARARWSTPAALAGLVVAATCATLSVDRKAWSLRHALTETTARVTQESETDLGAVAQSLRVSPAGTHFLATRASARRRTTGLGLLLGRFGGDVRELPAMGGDFVDNSRFLAVDALDGALEVRLERIDSIGAPIWIDTLPDVELIEPMVIIDRDAGSWAIVGNDADTDRIVLFAGKIGEKGARRVALPDSVVIMGQPIVFGDAATVMVSTYPRALRNGIASPLSLFSVFTADAMRTELWRVSGDSLTRVASLRGYPQCGEPSGGVAACAARHIQATSLYTVDANARVTEVAQLASPDLGVVALGPGARAASMKFDRSIVDIDLATRRLTRFELPPNSEFASEVRVGPGFVVTLSYGENRRSKVRRYRIEGSR